MTGKELQKAVIDLAHFKGWRVAHFQSVLATGHDGVPRWRTPVTADGKGFPDLFLVNPEFAAAIEVKGDGDRLRPEQEEWLAALTAAGIPCLVATSQCWKQGTVDAFLTWK